MDEDFAGGWVIYKEDMVYFAAYTYEIDEEVKNNGEQTGITKNHIYAGNLKTGEVYPLECEFRDTVIDLYGMYQNQLVLCPDSIANGIFAYAELDLQSEKKIDDETLYSGRLFVADLEKGCTYMLPEQQGLDFIVDYLDEKLWYSVINEQGKGLEVYDLKTGEKTKIPVETADLIIDGEAGNWFYGRVVSENDTFTYFHIWKNDYYAGKRNLVLEN